MLDAAQLSAAYDKASPFPHIVIEDAFDLDRVQKAAAEVRDLPVPAERDFYGTKFKRRLSTLEEMPPVTRGLVEEMQSQPFLDWLERLTGITGLHPDPHLEGGGVHQIGKGGYLKVHTDFNWSKKLELHRRINVLLYLNEGWQDAWKGHLELWPEDMSDGKQRIAPILNRMVVFSTTDFSFHGHPDPLECPDGVTRNSIALYYYSKERPESETRNGISDLTDYRERPTEKFSNVKHRLHQAMIRSPLFRKIMKH